MRSSGLMTHFRVREGCIAGQDVEFGTLGGTVDPPRDFASPFPTFSPGSGVGSDRVGEGHSVRCFARHGSIDVRVINDANEPLGPNRRRRRHTALHTCAVGGVPYGKWGEEGLACEVLREGSAATEEELIEFMREQLARCRLAKSVVFLTELPISGAGKILTRGLRQQFVSGS